MEPLLEELGKKDDDLKVLEQGTTSAVVSTSLDIGDDLTEEEHKNPYLSVPVQIVRHVFTIICFINLIFSMFGMVPYYIMTLGPPTIPITLLTCSGLTSAVFFTLMYAYTSVPWFIMFQISFFMVICSVSALINSVALFQAYAILFVETVYALLFSLTDNKHVQPWRSTLVMMISGLFVWLCGLYAFRQNWIMAALLFLLCVIFFPVYSGFIIDVIEGRYSLSHADLEAAIVDFYTECLTVSARCVKKLLSPSDVPAENIVIADPNATQDTWVIVQNATQKN
jgi:hypothetical protein